MYHVAHIAAYYWWLCQRYWDLCEDQPASIAVVPQSQDKTRS